MDVGVVGGWSWYEDVGGGYDHEGVYAVGFKGTLEGKGKGQWDCYNCASPGYFSKEHHYSQSCKSKGKGGFQGEFCNCG